jgi:hypothetical protein
MENIDRTQAGRSKRLVSLGRRPKNRETTLLAEEDSPDRR